jgi:hypothetical protein
MAAADAVNAARLAESTAVADAVTPPTREVGESNADFNERITQWYKDQPQPTLSDAQIKAGAYIKFVRTGKLGEGEYKILYPIGVKFDPSTGEPIVGTPGGNGAPGGNGVPGGNGNGFNTATGLSGDKVDAIAAIAALLSSYGIGGLADAITNAVKKGYSADTIQLIMQDPNSTDPLAVAFQTRFPANKARLAAGKPVLSAAEYLAAERSYAQVFQSYGLGNMAKSDNFNKFIAGDVSAAEVSDRISLAVNRVQNADPFVKQALGQFYPMLNQGDIVGAMLNPEEGLPALQRKVQISEIGGASLAQNLTTSLNALDTRTNFTNVMGGTMGAAELAALGITKEQARAGYANIAEVLPRSEFLSAITGGADYTQRQAEQEQFQGLASAKRAREALTGTERGRFGGSSGTAGARSFASQTRGEI